MGDDNELADLLRALQSLHGCGGTLESVQYVVERFEGKTAWEGPVHVLRLSGHPTAKTAYAWSHAIDGSAKRRYVVVLHKPPVDSPSKAVQAALVAEHRQPKP